MKTNLKLNEYIHRGVHMNQQEFDDTLWLIKSEILHNKTRIQTADCQLMLDKYKDKLYVAEQELDELKINNPEMFI
jgi:hypothetical protein